ncbi:MAG: SGNH/GDSL hydrolase family protein [Myxococcota bacterium]|nr:SGNH/GDSL hydrolase family protein [Myxococcota bacterium]
MNWKAKLSLGSLLLLPIVILSALSVWFFRVPSKPVSDAFLQRSSEQRRGWHSLIPNLKDAKVYVLDRPHEPEELKNVQLYQQKRVRMFRVSTNDLGMRNPPIGPKKGFRIVCVGESVSFGWGVDAEYTYPVQLAKQLGVEVINTAIPSTGLAQNTYWIENHAKELEPDLILLTIRPDWGHRNDLKQLARTLHETRRKIRPVPLGVIVSAISTFDRKGSEFFAWDEGQVKKTLRGIPLLELTTTFRKQKTENGVRLRIQNDKQQLVDVNSQAVLVEADNIPMLPGKSAVAPEILAAFDQNLALHEPLIFDAGHPDEKGYALMAETIAQWIRKKRWLPETEGSRGK